MIHATDTTMAAIIVAGGSGSRFNAGYNKVFELLDQKPIWFHSVGCFAMRDDVVSITLVLPESDRDTFDEQSRRWPLQHPVKLAPSGQQRFDSVASGLASTARDLAPLIAIHDAARPLVTQSDITAVAEAADRDGAAVLAQPISGSVKRLKGTLANNVDRRGLHVAQTPQVFKQDVIRQAYERHHGFPVTDDAQLVESSGHPVTLVPGARTNIKLTYPDDLLIAESILKSNRKYESSG
ncbi:MAG: 2-C-methyl-D-erythritol 4-phosphate cytidylyltransferase [Planctomycetota bacterium]